MTAFAPEPDDAIASEDEELEEQPNAREAADPSPSPPSPRPPEPSDTPEKAGPGLGGPDARTGGRVPVVRPKRGGGAAKSKKSAGRPTIVTFTSSPKGALVTIDGRRVGWTPVRDHRLEPGTHKLKMVKGRRGVEGEISVSGGSVSYEWKVSSGKVKAKQTVEAR